MTKRILFFASAFVPLLLSLKSNAHKEMLVKVKSPAIFAQNLSASFGSSSQLAVETISQDAEGGWVLISSPSTQQTRKVITALKQSPSFKDQVLDSQPNYRIRLLDNPSLAGLSPNERAQLKKAASLLAVKKMPPDNPPIPASPGQTVGADPMVNKQWGMLDIGAPATWMKHRGSPDMIVAVIDTGVDYTHPDLLPNLWRNTGEIPGNRVDDDKNGYVDDLIGWDFVSNDHLPFDLAVEPLQLLAGKGNPGHGTHCAGNVAARGENGQGISGVAPNVKIMVLRFISDEGFGTTAGAIKSIRYAVDNGAQITSNSWGSEGEDPSNGEENRALREVIQYAQDRNSLFVAAAGNGHSGKGYDNDTDARPAYPASYPHDIILSVAAINAKNVLGGFSNWGLKSVDIAAPGVVVFSTTVGGLYSDKVIDLAAMEVTWDGTSMATPHVAGAAALYWSANPGMTALQVKEAILRSAEPVAGYKNKLVSGGKLSLTNLLR